MVTLATSRPPQDHLSTLIWLHRHSVWWIWTLQDHLKTTTGLPPDSHTPHFGCTGIVFGDFGHLKTTTGSILVHFGTSRPPQDHHWARQGSILVHFGSPRPATRPPWARQGSILVHFGLSRPSQDHHWDRQGSILVHFGTSRPPQDHYNPTAGIHRGRFCCTLAAPRTLPGRFYSKIAVRALAIFLRSAYRRTHQKQLKPAQA